MNALVTRRNGGPVSLWSDMDRLMDSVFSDIGWQTAPGYPRVDVRQTGEGYTLEAELPGLTEKDVTVRVEENRLVLESSREEEHEEKQNGYLLRERYSRSFRRSFQLPNDVDRERISAQFRNGLLTLTLPRSEESKPRVIDIKTR